MCMLYWSLLCITPQSHTEKIGTLCSVHKQEILLYAPTKHDILSACGSLWITQVIAFGLVCTSLILDSWLGLDSIFEQNSRFDPAYNSWYQSLSKAWFVKLSKIGTRRLMVLSHNRQNFEGADPTKARHVRYGLIGYPLGQTHQKFKWGSLQHPGLTWRRLGHFVQYISKNNTTNYINKSWLFWGLW